MLGVCEPGIALGLTGHFLQEEISAGRQHILGGAGDGKDAAPSV